VLTREAHRGALEQQRAVGEHLGAAPVDALAASDHLETLLVLLLDLRVRVEAFGDARRALGDLLEALARHGGVRGAVLAGGAEPAPGVAEAEHLLTRPEVARVGEGEVEDLVDLLAHAVELFGPEAVLLDEPRRV